MITVTQFLNEKMDGILKVERDNKGLIHLYHVNDSWSAVEKSAYYLSQFTCCQVITLLNQNHDEGNNGQIVLASTSETQLINARKAYSVVLDNGDHMILKPKNIPTHYSEWHQENILQDLEDHDFQ